jgi:general secretion pathway protein D
MTKRILIPALLLLAGASTMMQAQQPPVVPAPGAPAAVPIGNMSLQNASLTEVIDSMAKTLKINYILDPRVKGSVILNTYGETRGLDTRNMLDLILRINNAAMVQEGDLFRIVPLSDIGKQPVKLQVNAKDMPEDDQIMLNLIFLKYVTVDELGKILTEFTGENAKILSYAPANLLFIMDSRRNMKRTMELISLFDSDMFTNERVKLFELKNARPSDLVKDLESVLKSISLDAKTSTVHFLPVDRIGTLIAVAPNPGVFDTVEVWIKKLDVPTVLATAGITDNYVYHVKYGRADCLAIALGNLFGLPGGNTNYNSGFNSGAFGSAYAPSPYTSSPYGGAYGGAYGAYGGGIGGAYGGSNAGQPGGWGSSNGFSGSFGGSGGCAAGGSTVVGGQGGTYGSPSFGGFASQAPLMGAAAPAAGQTPAGQNGTPTNPAAPMEVPPRIVANPLDNSLLIQADPAHYQSILKLLQELDVPPRQILLEAKIYSVDLTDAFSSGIQAAYQARSGKDLSFLGQVSQGIANFSAGALVGHSRELLAYLSLQENASHAHVISEPSLIATDSIPASINVGTQVPVLTSQVSTAVQISATNAYNQSISGVSTGATLQVNARVTPSGVVTLIINQEISAPAPTNPTGNALTPSFDQQVVQTQITMQDGDTIAIGGLIKQTGTWASAGVPFLSKIPYLGILFGSKTYSTERSELIIFMTPHIIYDEADLIEASDELAARVKKLRKYVRQ